MSAALALVLAPAALALFMFVFTRGTLLLRDARGANRSADSHIYPVYSQRWLMRVVDFQPLISAILLFQYDRLAGGIARGIGRQALAGREVLVTSCAFGNVIPKVVNAALKAGAARVRVTDLLQVELDHVARKLEPDSRVLMEVHDANRMNLPDRSVHANVIYFLFHELPHDQKTRVLDEALRVLAPGGTLWIAEFHRPSRRVLRALSWLYFKTFEPLGLALWHEHDPWRLLGAMPDLVCRRSCLLAENFQLIEATRLPEPATATDGKLAAGVPGLAAGAQA